jgi:hypothetical protein
MKADEAKELLRRLREENQRLKRMVADQALRPAGWLRIQEP